MKAHVVWGRGSERPAGAWRRVLAGVEWVLLLTGLAALDVYIWINTSAMVYQTYEDWAFDQDLRGLAATPLQFAGAEIGALLGRERTKVETPPAVVAESEAPPGSTARSAKPLARSAVIGRLEIPNLHLVAMVREGADAGTLRRAVGHIPGTALPGGQGNVGLAGHRDTFFRALRNIRVDDEIELQTEDDTYRYAVEWTKIVGPREVQVLASRGGQSLTLVTCYPFYYVGSAPKRFVVRASLMAGDRR